MTSAGMPLGSLLMIQSLYMPILHSKLLTTPNSLVTQFTTSAITFLQTYIKISSYFNTCCFLLILFLIWSETMGNIISLDTIGERISMSNGLTSVFIDVLGLSGTHLAKTAAEKRMIVWLLEKDQSAVGGGSVGFDVSEMPWTDTDFDDMKRFMLDVIEEIGRAHV